MGAQIGKHIQSDCNGNHSVLTTTAARNHDQHHAKQNMNEGNVDAGANMLYGDVVNKQEPVDDVANDLTEVTNPDSVELKEQILAEVYKQSKKQEIVEKVKCEDLLNEKLMEIKENSIKKEADHKEIENEKHTDEMQMHEVQNDEMPLDEAQLDEMQKNEVQTDEVQNNEEHSQKKELLVKKEILVTALEEDLHTLKQFKFEFPKKEDEELQSSSGTDNFWDALTTAPSTQASIKTEFIKTEPIEQKFSDAFKMLYNPFATKNYYSLVKLENICDEEKIKSENRYNLIKTKTIKKEPNSFELQKTVVKKEPITASVIHACDTADNINNDFETNAQSKTELFETTVESKAELETASNFDTVSEISNNFNVAFLEMPTQFKTELPNGTSTEFKTELEVDVKFDIVTAKTLNINNNCFDNVANFDNVHEKSIALKSELLGTASKSKAELKTASTIAASFETPIQFKTETPTDVKFDIVTDKTFDFNNQNLKKVVNFENVLETAIQLKSELLEAATANFDNVHENAIVLKSELFQRASKYNAKLETEPNIFTSFETTTQFKTEPPNDAKLDLVPERTLNFNNEVFEKDRNFDNMLGAAFVLMSQLLEAATECIAKHETVSNVDTASEISYASFETSIQLRTESPIDVEFDIVMDKNLNFNNENIANVANFDNVLEAAIVLKAELMEAAVKSNAELGSTSNFNTVSKISNGSIETPTQFKTESPIDVKVDIETAETMNFNSVSFANDPNIDNVLETAIALKSELLETATKSNVKLETVSNYDTVSEISNASFETPAQLKTESSIDENFDIEANKTFNFNDQNFEKVVNFDNVFDTAIQLKSELLEAATKPKTELETVSSFDNVSQISRTSFATPTQFKTDSPIDVKFNIETDQTLNVNSASFENIANFDNVHETTIALKSELLEIDANSNVALETSSNFDTVSVLSTASFATPTQFKTESPIDDKFDTATNTTLNFNNENSEKFVKFDNVPERVGKSYIATEEHIKFEAVEELQALRHETIATVAARALCNTLQSNMKKRKPLVRLQRLNAAGFGNVAAIKEELLLNNTISNKCKLKPCVRLRRLSAISSYATARSTSATAEMVEATALNIKNKTFSTEDAIKKESSQLGIAPASTPNKRHKIVPDFETTPSKSLKLEPMGVATTTKSRLSLNPLVRLRKTVLTSETETSKNTNSSSPLQHSPLVRACDIKWPSTDGAAVEYRQAPNIADAVATKCHNASAFKLHMIINDVSKRDKFKQQLEQLSKKPVIKIKRLKVWPKKQIQKKRKPRKKSLDRPYKCKIPIEIIEHEIITRKRHESLSLSTGNQQSIEINTIANQCIKEKTNEIPNNKNLQSKQDFIENWPRPLAVDIKNPQKSLATMVMPRLKLSTNVENLIKRKNLEPLVRLKRLKLENLLELSSGRFLLTDQEFYSMVDEEQDERNRVEQALEKQRHEKYQQQKETEKSQPLLIVKLEKTNETNFFERPCATKRIKGEKTAAKNHLTIGSVFSLKPRVRVKRLKLCNIVESTVNDSENQIKTKSNRLANKEMHCIKVEPKDFEQNQTTDDDDHVEDHEIAYETNTCPQLDNDSGVYFDMHDSTLSEPTPSELNFPDIEHFGIAERTQFSRLLENSSESLQLTVQLEQLCFADRLLLADIVTERALINYSLTQSGFSPIQFRLHNSFDELNVFFNYLLDK